MAPSSFNRQPWRFIIDGGKVILVVKSDDFSSDYEGKIDKYTEMFKNPEDISPEEVQDDMWYRIIGFDQ